VTRPKQEKNCRRHERRLVRAGGRASHVLEITAKMIRFVPCLVFVLSFAVSGELAVGGELAALPKPTFYCTFDRGENADFSVGKGYAFVSAPDAILYEAALRTKPGSDPHIVPGKVNKARHFEAGVTFPVQGNFNPLRGTIMMWVRPDWHGTRDDLYATFFGCKDWGLIYKYTTQSYITFGWIKNDGYFEYGNIADISSWQPGEWHHLAVTYDATKAKQRALYLDGKKTSSHEIPSFRKCEPVFFVGSSYGGTNPARAALDELAVFDRPLSDEEIAEAYALGGRGRPLFPDLVRPADEQKALQPPAPGARPPLPSFVNWKLPEGPPTREWRRADQRGGRIATAARERISLNGIWRFRPEGAPAWYYLRVPGSWHPPGQFKVRRRDGSTVTAIEKVPLKAVEAAWYERTFVLPAGWEQRRVVLGVDSVRAVGEVFLNGRKLGRAIEFQRSEFDVSQVVKPGDNLLQIRVHVLKPGCTFRGLDEDVWLESRPAVRTSNGPTSIPW